MRGRTRSKMESEAARPVGLFFDLGDTLVDLRGLGPAMAREIARRFAIGGRALEVLVSAWVVGTADATAKAQNRFVPGVEIAGTVLRNVLTGVDIDLSLPGAVQLVRTAWAGYLPAAKFHDDVTPALLRGLRRQVERMGIVTDSDTSMVEPLLDRLGIRGLFDVVVVSDSVKAYKPNPRIFLAALKGGRPQDSVFVSNSRIDLEGATAVGMQAVWVRRGGEPDRGPPPSAHVIDDLRKLPELLDCLTRSGAGPVRG